MKSILKDFVNSSRTNLPFTEIDDGIIECQGIILKRLTKRIKNKKFVIEYYKCQNTYSRHKHCGPCKFSGKIKYKTNQKPKSLEIIKNHSLFCLNNEGNKLYLSKIERNLLTDKQVTSFPLEHYIYSNIIPNAKLSIQIHKEEINTTYSISNEVDKDLSIQ
jgi:hypothetical protein